MGDRKLRIGLIGAGGFAAQHMEAFASVPDVEVVAFMRRSEGPLREMQERWGVPKGYTDHRAMLDDPDIDAIDIITPTDSHKQYALDATASGRPVLCEKPLALNAADCQIMLDAARSAGVIHAVNFNQRGADTCRTDGAIYRRWIRWGCLPREHQMGNVDAAGRPTRCRVMAILARKTAEAPCTN